MVGNDIMVWDLVASTIINYFVWVSINLLQKYYMPNKHSVCVDVINYK